MHGMAVDTCQPVPALFVSRCEALSFAFCVALFAQGCEHSGAHTPDAGGSTVVGGACALASAYVFTVVYNPFADDRDTLMIMPDGRLEYAAPDSRYVGIGRHDSNACVINLPACHDPSQIDAADLTRDLASPAVQKELREQAVVGEHPADAGGVSITRSTDGHKF